MSIDWVSVTGTSMGTVIGVGASVYLFHHQINKLLSKTYNAVQKLSQQMQIFNDRSGVVTYDQAVEIVDMYLVGIEYSLRSHALSYFNGNYKIDFQNENIASIEASMDSILRQIKLLIVVEDKLLYLDYRKVRRLNIFLRSCTR